MIVYGVLNEMSYRKMLPKIPVIVTSVDGDEASELKSLSLGAKVISLASRIIPLLLKETSKYNTPQRNSIACELHPQMDTLTGVYSKETFLKTKEILKHGKDKRYAIVYSDIENFQL